VMVTISLVEEQTTRDFDRVAVTARGARGDYEITPKTVHLRLFGPRRILEKFEPASDQVYVNLQGLAAGEHSVTLEVNLPPELKVVEQKPVRFRIKIGKPRS